jgi:hypothetical protein
MAERAIPGTTLSRWEQATEPEGDLQSLGFGGEQVGEFFIPGMGEERAGLLAEKGLPALGRFAAPIGRTAYNAGTQGLLNRVQGGSFRQGAELGGAGSLIGEGARTLAPSIAESALGITKQQRGFGRTPGKSVLDEVSGVRPATIARNANSRIGGLTADLEQRADARSLGLLTGRAPASMAASTQPAIDLIDKEMAKAAGQNAEGYYNQLAVLRRQLTNDFRTGQRLPTQMTPRQILELKRGVGSLEKGWNPEQRGIARGTVRRVYAALDGELDRTVPGAQELNQRISSLIPAAQRAESANRGAGITQRVGHRIAAHTGALAGSMGGAVLGYQHGGAPEAAAGALAGAVGPELLASPTARMIGARSLASPVTGRAFRALGTRLLDREDDDEER